MRWSHQICGGPCYPCTTAPKVLANLALGCKAVLGRRCEGLHPEHMPDLADDRKVPMVGHLQSEARHLHRMEIRSCTPWSTRCGERLGNVWNLRCRTYMIRFGNRWRPIVPCKKSLWMNDRRHHSRLKCLWEVLWVRPKRTSSTSGQRLCLAAACKHIEPGSLGRRLGLPRRLNRCGHIERLRWSSAWSGERGLQSPHTFHDALWRHVHCVQPTACNNKVQ